MSIRKLRMGIAQETVDIMKQGFYVTARGRKVKVAHAVQAAKEGSVLYRPKEFEQVFEQRDALLDALKHETKIEIVDATTLGGVTYLHEQGFEPDEVVCLNFASAKNPGGGFLSGSQAQEESLARASSLYSCLVRFKDSMYNFNRKFDSCLYTDHMIYSPHIPVFRDDDDQLIDTSYTVSMITAPAVNAGAVKRKERDRVQAVMHQRMEKLLSVAVVRQHLCIVLGAWGCGVFRNKPTSIAQLFKEHLTGNGLFAKAFKHVVFAIPANYRQHSAFDDFEEIFN